MPPPDGGPERLIIAVVFKDPENTPTDLSQLRMSFNSAVQKKLNPLFRVQISNQLILHLAKWKIAYANLMIKCDCAGL